MRWSFSFFLHLLSKLIVGVDARARETLKRYVHTKFTRRLCLHSRSLSLLLHTTACAFTSIDCSVSFLPNGRPFVLPFFHSLSSLLSRAGVMFFDRYSSSSSAVALDIDVTTVEERKKPALYIEQERRRIKECIVEEARLMAVHTHI